MSKSCKGALRDLVKCAIQSDCYKETKDVKSCLKEDECRKYREAYFACKRDRDGIRTSFSGPKQERYKRRGFLVESRSRRRNQTKKPSETSSRRNGAAQLEMSKEQRRAHKGTINVGMDTLEDVDVEFLQSSEDSDLDDDLSIFEKSESRGGQVNVDFEEIANSFPFELDKFQSVAIQELLSGKSVVVCAPTGAGKTAIADAAAMACLSKGQKVIYTTPLKALSNQKLYEFRQRFGFYRTGLITGDSAIQCHASIIVMTTEILRNMFYDVAVEAAELKDRLDEIGLVVLDEVHYLGIPGRGSVWEELIVGCPKHIQMLCMSATVANPQDIGEWIAQIHGPCSTIKTSKRPVPLSWHFAFRKANTQLAEIAPLLNAKRTSVNPVCIYKEKTGFGKEPDVEVQPASRIPPMESLLRLMNERDLLPAIFFIFSRSDCDRQAERMHNMNICLTTPKEKEQIRNALNILQEDQPEAVKIKCANALINGIATHHAGCLPAWKVLVETLFQDGLLKAVFATGTLAAGINMPARTTVITSLSRLIDGSSSIIEHNELLQMAGRAGRRGFDTAGNCIIAQSRFEGAKEAVSILKKGSEPLNSQFQTGYSFVLNLLSKFTLDEAKIFLEKSFRSYLTGIGLVKRAAEIKELKKTAKELKSQSESSADDEETDESGQLSLQELKDQIQEATTALGAALSAARKERGSAVNEWLKGREFPFPLLLDTTKNALGFNVMPAIALGERVKKGKDTGRRLICLASDNSFYRLTSESIVGVIDDVKLDRQIFKNVMERVTTTKTRWTTTATSTVAECPGNAQTAKLAFKTPHPNMFERLSWSPATQINIDALSARAKQAKEALKTSTPSPSPIIKKKLRVAQKRLRTALRLKNELESHKEDGWNGFVSAVDILIKVGALDEKTLEIRPLGHVTRELFGENELWMAMVFTHETVQMLKPPLLAALASTFVTPSICSRPTVHIQLPPPVQVEQILVELDEARSMLFEYEVTTSSFNRQSLIGLEMDSRAAGLIEAWASGCQWSDLADATNLDDGDLARLLSSTLDILRQIQLSKHLLDPLKESARKAFRDMNRKPIRTSVE